MSISSRRDAQADAERAYDEAVRELLATLLAVKPGWWPDMYTSWDHFVAFTQAHALWSTLAKRRAG